METPQERRLLETISYRSKKDETRKIMAIDPHRQQLQRFLYVTSQAHHKELRRIERVRAGARENQQMVESVCRSDRRRTTTTGCCPLCSGTDSVCPPPGEPPRSERGVGWRCSRGGLCRTRTFPCQPPVSGVAQRGVDLSLKTYERLRKGQFEPNEEDWSDAVTIRRPTKLPMDRRMEQELRLKKNILSHQRSKTENSSNDWFTNYGKPISSRKIMNPVRP